MKNLEVVDVKLLAYTALGRAIFFDRTVHFKDNTLFLLTPAQYLEVSRDFRKKGKSRNGGPGIL